MSSAFGDPPISQTVSGRLRKRPQRDNPTPHTCDQCSKGFGSLVGLNSHRRMMHKDGYQPKRCRSGSISVDGGEDQDRRSHEENRCLKCESINVRKRGINCIQCRGRYHVTCVNMTLDQADKIPNYLCRTCRDGTDMNSGPSNADSRLPPILICSNT